MFDITIEIQGREHSGKTSAIAVIAQQLRELGAIVHVQQVDQLDEKQADLDRAKNRLEGTSVFIRETHTSI
jgi:molybdopterin-guanine dinucleotide biosynthesis protein